MSRSKLIPMAFAAAFSFAVFADQPGQPGGANAKGANQQDQSGEAVVITRDGPAIALENNAQPIIAVAFPGQQGQGQPQQPGAPAQPQAQSHGSEGVEVSILVANPNEAAKAKEVLFQSRNAANGMVVYNGNEMGGAQTAAAQQPAQPNAKEKQTQLIFSARLNGRPAKVTELVSQGNARILIVKHSDESQAKAAQPGQPQPAAAKEAGKAQAEANDAVIFVYLRGEQAK
jgi:hypothetical protein